MDNLDLESDSVSSNEEELSRVQVSDFSEIFSAKSSKSLPKSKKEIAEDFDSSVDYKEEQALMKIFDCESIKGFSYEPCLASRVYMPVQTPQYHITATPNEPVNSIMFDTEEEKN